MGKEILEEKFHAQWYEGTGRSVTYAYKARLEKKFRQEIQDRGGETAIEGKFSSTSVGLVDWERLGPERRTLYLLKAEGWRKYGGQPARWARLAYLCGQDDNGPWAVRVPGNTSTAQNAWEWLVPSAVHHAWELDLKVLRQGDVYAVQVGRDRADETAEELRGHTWCPTSRLLLHDGQSHRPLKVPFKCRFIQQRTYQMGRTGRWGGGD